MKSTKNKISKHVKTVSQFQIYGSNFIFYWKRFSGPNMGA